MNRLAEALGLPAEVVERVAANARAERPRRDLAAHVIRLARSRSIARLKAHVELRRR